MNLINMELLKMENEMKLIFLCRYTAWQSYTEHELQSFNKQENKNGNNK